MTRKDTEFIDRRGLRYTVAAGGRIRRSKPWLGDAFSFLYDGIMEKSVFPKKFAASVGEHERILSRELGHVHGKRVLELATGSGSAVRFLSSDNSYTGTDISPGLLRRAARRFAEAGFREAAFYVASADELPFQDDSFDVGLCMLSLNFFPDLRRVLDEVERVLARGGVLVCSVPVPERRKTRSPIRGTLYSEEELARLCRERGFRFEALPEHNGTLLYFRAILTGPGEAGRRKTGQPGQTGRSGQSGQSGRSGRRKTGQPGLIGRSGQPGQTGLSKPRR